MRKVTLIFGLIAGAIVSAFVVVLIVVWVKNGKIIDNLLVGYAAMVVALSMVFFGIKSYRDNYQSGKIRFWKGFQVGLFITLIASLMYTITWETYVQVSPGSSEAFIDYYAKCQVDKLKEKGVSAAELDQEIRKMDDFKNMYRNPVIRFSMTLMEILPVGIIITLISAAILRKKEFLSA
jgi:amino acid transporter